MTHATYPDTALLDFSIPGVRILPAVTGRTYQANQVPTAVTPEFIEWTLLGPEEQFNVILHRATADVPAHVEVVECTWNEDERDWNSALVQDTSGIDLTVFLP